LPSSTSIMAEWGVATGAMGLTIFSVGVLGVGLGSFGLAPIADALQTLRQPGKYENPVQLVAVQPGDERQLRGLRRRTEVVVRNREVLAQGRGHFQQRCGHGGESLRVDS